MDLDLRRPLIRAKSASSGKPPGESSHGMHGALAWVQKSSGTFLTLLAHVILHLRPKSLLNCDSQENRHPSLFRSPRRRLS